MNIEEIVTTRNIASYNPQVLTAIDKDTLDEITLYSIPVRLYLWDGILRLTVEIYEKDKFENRQTFIHKRNRDFVLNYAEVKKDYQFLEEIENAFYKWLGANPNEFSMQMLDINLKSLQLQANAQHKTDNSFHLERNAFTLEKFEKVKAEHPELVMNYFAFARTYSAINDKYLAKFE